MPERLHPYADFFAKVMDKFDKIIDTIARKNIVVLLSIASKNAPQVFKTGVLRFSVSAMSRFGYALSKTDLRNVVAVELKVSERLPDCSGIFLPGYSSASKIPSRSMHSMAGNTTFDLTMKRTV